MRYIKLAILSLMLGCVLALSPNTTSATEKNYCWDCYSQVGNVHMCFNFASCGQEWGQCNYEETPASWCYSEPFLVSCCLGE